MVCANTTEKNISIDVAKVRPFFKCCSKNLPNVPKSLLIATTLDNFSEIFSVYLFSSFFKALISN